jgi:hypothetical protein
MSAHTLYKRANGAFEGTAPFVVIVIWSTLSANSPKWPVQAALAFGALVYLGKQVTAALARRTAPPVAEPGSYPCSCGGRRPEDVARTVTGGGLNSAIAAELAKQQVHH